MLPFVAAGLLGCVRSWRIAAWINAGFATLGCALAARLAFFPAQVGALLLADRLAVHLAILTAFVAMTASWFGITSGRAAPAARLVDARRPRLYHAMFQLLAGGIMLALLSNDLSLAWIGIETATMASALMAGLPRTDHAMQASWEMLVLRGVGLALALFGTVALYRAALPALEPGLPALTWTALRVAAPRCDGATLNVAFVFLLLGYAATAALAPLYACLPDAPADAPTPVSAVLAGSIPNVALLVLLRLRDVMANAGPAAIRPGPPIMALGLLSVLLAAVSLWPRRDALQFFAVSTIAQSGLAAFAFALGGPAADFAGLLHVTVHTLAHASVFQCLGRAARLKGGQEFARIGGLIGTHRALGLTLAAGIVALAAPPPFGLFTSMFLILTAAVRQQPALAAPLTLGLLVGAWAVLRAGQALCLGPPTPDHGPKPRRFELTAVWVLLAIVAWLGLATPGPLVAWMRAIAGAA